MTWSIRLARKTVHSYLPNCKDIVIYTNYDIDSSDVRLILHYNQQITNTGKKTITLSFSDQVYTARRSDPGNTLFWELQATAGHSITLSPNESRTIDDTLGFYSTWEQLPTFTYPGSVGSLYSATTLSDPTDINGQHVRSFLAGDRGQSDEYILKAYISERDILSSRIGSVGRTYDQARTDNVSYVSKLQLGEALITHIVYDRMAGLYNMEALYYSGSQKDVALQRVSDVIRVLDGLRVRAINVAPSGQRERKWELHDEHNVIIGSIALNYSPSFKKYEAVLTIYGVKR